VSSDYPIAVGQDGYFYYAPSSTSDLRLIRVEPSGETKVTASLPTSPSGERHQYLNGIAKGPDSSLYYTDHNTIRRLAKDGRVSTVATVTPLANGPSIPGVGQHPYLRDLDVDSNGVVYVADNGDARVLKITPDGNITTLFQTQSPWAPTAVAVFRDTVYSLEFSHTDSDNRVEWMPRIRKITPEGKSEIILTVDQMPGAR
jgi:DNA-binding beta-propeller fold protein YncE